MFRDCVIILDSEGDDMILDDVISAYRELLLFGEKIENSSSTSKIGILLERILLMHICMKKVVTTSLWEYRHFSRSRIMWNSAIM